MRYTNTAVSAQSIIVILNKFPNAVSRLSRARAGARQLTSSKSVRRQYASLVDSMPTSELTLCLWCLTVTPSLVTTMRKETGYHQLRQVFYLFRPKYVEMEGEGWANSHRYALAESQRDVIRYLYCGCLMTEFFS